MFKAISSLFVVQDDVETHCDDILEDIQKETDMAEFVAEPVVVQRTVSVDVMHTAFEPQEIRFDHCVQFMQVDKFYGDYQIVDEHDRVLGTSKEGKFSFLRKDLTTDVAKVWYDATSKTDPEYILFKDKHNVADPGMNLKVVKLRIRFIHAPLETDRVYFHIPMFLRTNGVWDPLAFKLI